jgi:hypothetical protein
MLSKMKKFQKKYEYKYSKTKMAYHYIFLLAVLYIFGFTIYNPELFWSACLTLTFVFHWWIGILVYFHLPSKKHIHSPSSYFLYSLIGFCLISGIIFLYNPIVLLATFGLAFICTITLYHQILRFDDNKEHRWFIKQKYFLEYLGVIGFFISAATIYLHILSTTFVMCIFTLTHLSVLIFLFITKSYKKIICDLDMKFLLE